MVRGRKQKTEKNRLQNALCKAGRMG